MFRQCTEEEYERLSGGGTRHLFVLDSFELHDGIDEEGGMRHFVLETTEDGEEDRVYEADRATMYEFLARFLAGEYEKREYDLETSPAHAMLLDLLEIATARARAGDPEFAVDELEGEFGDEEEESR